MDEEPPVFGQWANIARSRMRHESPEEWIEMVQQGTASVYLKKVQEETAETFRTNAGRGAYQARYKVEDKLVRKC